MLRRGARVFSEYPFGYREARRPPRKCWFNETRVGGLYRFGYHEARHPSGVTKRVVRPRK